MGEKELLPKGVVQFAHMLTGKIGHVHLIDSDGTLHDGDTSTHAPLGTGKLDFDEIIPAILDAGYKDEWCTIDLCFWPVSYTHLEFKAVSAVARTFIKERYSDESGKKEKVDVDDAVAAAVEFENGAIGTIEASRFCPGRKNFNAIEINGEKGSIWWDLENMNNLHVYWRDEEPEATRGFHCINVTESYHPYYDQWLSLIHI